MPARARRHDLVAQLARCPGRMDAAASNSLRYPATSGCTSAGLVHRVRPFARGDAPSLRRMQAAAIVPAAVPRLVTFAGLAPCCSRGTSSALVVSLADRYHPVWPF